MKIHRRKRPQFDKTFEQLENRLCLTAVTFLPTDIFVGGGSLGARVSAIGDFDGDGDSDVLSGGSYRQLAWYENENNGQFKQAHDVPLGISAPSHFVTTDMDGDGDLDFVAAGSSAQLAWYENTDGAGSFTARPDDLRGFTDDVSYLFAGDMDQDGDVDVVTTHGKGKQRIVLHENNGQNHFENRHVVYEANPTTGFGSGLASIVADTDNDGDLDIVVAFADRRQFDIDVIFGNGEIVLLENLGGVNNFEDPATVDAWNVEDYPRFFDFADMDGDGDLDLINGTSNYYGDRHRLTWYENTNGRGEFNQNEQQIGSGLSKINFLDVADFDADGDNDVLVSDKNSGLSVVYLNTDGGFPDKMDIELSPRHGGVAVGDLNGDQRADIVTTDSDVVWYPNHGEIENFNRTVIREALNMESVDYADFDNDGDLDLISAGDRLLRFENIDGRGEFQLVERLSTARFANAIDLDVDGDLDIIASGTELVWHENLDGGGTFGSAQPLQTNGVLQQHVVDMDGDGDPDLLTQSSVEIAWLENVDGDGQLEKHVIEFDRENRFDSVFAEDVDADGDFDVIAGTQRQTAQWYSNNGDKTFSVATVIGSPAFFVSAGDLNNDSHTDIVFLGVDEIAIRQTTGDGNLGDVSRFQSASSANSIVSLADLDDDGDQDMLVGTHGTGILWHENSSGEFLPARLISDRLDFPQDIKVADFDGDGDLDIVSASLRDGRVAWYENVGVPGDANGDGKFDSSDLVKVFIAGEFEDEIDRNSTKEEGDFNGDGDFTTSDLVFAFVNGDYIAASVAATLIFDIDRERDDQFKPALEQPHETERDSMIGPKQQWKPAWAY